MPRPLIDIQSDWRPTPVANLPSWADARRVAIDCETCDPQLKDLGIGVRRTGHMVGISLAIEDGPSFYLPFGHEGGDNLPQDQVLRYITTEAKNFHGDVCGANLQYDLDYMEEAGIRFPAARFFRDVQVAEPLLDELQFTYGLDAIAARHGLPGKDERGLDAAARRWWIHPKADMWRLPARHVGPYAEQDVRLPLQLLRRQEKLIEEQELQEVYDLESRVLPVLLKMRRRGVRIDFDHLARVEQRCMAEEVQALDEVRRHTGTQLAPSDLSKPDAIAGALAKVGIVFPPTTKGRPSVKKDTLAMFDHPAARAISVARKWNKIRTTFVTSIRDYQTGGRIHATFHQLKAQKDDGDDAGAAYGRLSSSDPNIQQQPARDKEIGPLWRSIYLPEGGCRWFACDFSGQEPRMAVHYAAVVGCRGAAAMVDRYALNKKTDLHQETANLAGIERSLAKEIFLGLAYGMGPGKLCRKLGFATVWKDKWNGGGKYEAAGPEGEAFLRKFNGLVPFLGDLAKMAQDTAKGRGYVRTMSGRRCHFPMFGTKYEYTHKALNRIIQGSAADQTKRALIEVDAAGYFLQLQVHDELDGSCASEADGCKIAEIMETCTPLQVPSLSDVEIGPSWGQAKKVAR